MSFVVRPPVFVRVILVAGDRKEEGGVMVMIDLDDGGDDT